MSDEVNVTLSEETPINAFVSVIDSFAVTLSSDPNVTVQTVQESIDVLIAEEEAIEVAVTMANGVPGPAGAPGPGIPEGGATGQILAKKSADDLDAEWIDPPASSESDPLSLHLSVPNQTVTQKPQFNSGLAIKENQWVYLDGV